jgi:hypothetical protein
MLHTRRRTLRAAAVAAVAAAGLVMTAAPGTAESNHHSASAASTKDKEWTQTGTGASITQPDGSMLLVASVENSLDGDGATVGKVTLNGNSGTDTATRYTANGVGKFEEEFTLPSVASGDRGEQGHRLRGAACQSAHLIGGVGSRQDVGGLPRGSEHDRPDDPLYRAVFSLFAKTMRAKRGLLEDGGADFGE